MKIGPLNKFYFRPHLFIIIIAFLLLPECVHSAEQLKDGIQFEVRTVSGAERYLELLAYPPYLALALENNGIRPSQTSPFIIVDRHTLQFKRIFLQFIERKGALFIYEGKVELKLANMDFSLKTKTTVDTSQISKGLVYINVNTSGAKLIPSAVIEHFRAKIQELANETIQKKLITYFDEIIKQKLPGRGTWGMEEYILIQSYNRMSNAFAGTSLIREPGDAEPLSDQVLFLITVAIWFFIVPFVWLTIYFWRRRKRRRLGNVLSDS